MADTHTVSGLLSEKNVRRAMEQTRRGTIGPTALYYAGVTAPIISASMAVVAKASLMRAGFGDMTQWFVSTLVAAMAGISWYLIFIRWSYRTAAGRGTELTEKTRIDAGDKLVIARGGVETHIDWAAVEKIKTSSKATTLIVRGADAVIIPDDWFGDDKGKRKAFIARLRERMGR